MRFRKQTSFSVRLLFKINSPSNPHFVVSRQPATWESDQESVFPGNPDNQNIVYRFITSFLAMAKFYTVAKEAKCAGIADYFL